MPLSPLWLAVMVAAWWSDHLTMPAFFLFGIPSGIFCLGFDIGSSDDD